MDFLIFFINYMYRKDRNLAQTKRLHKNFFSNISLIDFLSFIKIIKKFETNIKNF